MEQKEVWGLFEENKHNAVQMEQLYKKEDSLSSINTDESSEKESSNE